jgi:hypothetical protein
MILTAIAGDLITEPLFIPFGLLQHYCIESPKVVEMYDKVLTRLLLGRSLVSLQ